MSGNYDAAHGSDSLPGVDRGVREIRQAFFGAGGAPTCPDRAKFFITTLGRRGAGMLSRDQRENQQLKASGRELMKEILSVLDDKQGAHSAMPHRQINATQEACISISRLAEKEDIDN